MTFMRPYILLVKSIPLLKFFMLLKREIMRFVHVTHWRHPRRRQDRLLILLCFLFGIGGTAIYEDMSQIWQQAGLNTVENLQVPQQALEKKIEQVLNETQQVLPSDIFTLIKESDALHSPSSQSVTVAPTVKRAFTLSKQFDTGIKSEVVNPEKTDQNVDQFLYPEQQQYAHIPLPAKKPDSLISGYQEPETNRRLPAIKERDTSVGPLKKLAIVIDDLGMDRLHTGQVIDLPAPLTLAFLPYAQNIEGYLKRASTKNHEIIIHFPMQPKGNANPGPHALNVSMTTDALYREILWNFSQFPGFAGINNHMGSLFTENEALLSYVMSEVARRDVYFLDSRTTSKSKGQKLAKEYGARFAQRDVFLDNIRSLEAINKQIRLADRILQKYGKVIVIGHPYAVTITALRQWIDRLPENVSLVPVSQLVKKYSVPETQAAGTASAAPGMLY